MKWISVKDELPAMGDAVLACLDFWGNPVVCFRTDDGWAWDNVDVSIDDSDVTHWQPLPELPK